MYNVRADEQARDDDDIEIDLDQELGLDETFDHDTDTSDVETFEETAYSVSRVSRHSKIIEQVSLSLHHLYEADRNRAQDQSDPQRVIRTLSETNHSLLVESELLEALVLFTTVKRSYLLDLDLGIGNITANLLLELAVVLREVSFFQRPINSLDPSFHLSLYYQRKLVDCSLVSLPS